MATPGNVSIQIRRQRDFYLSIEEKTAQGNPWDLRGYKICFAVKKAVTDTDAQAMFLTENFYSSNLAFGQYSFLIPHTTTAGSGSNVSSAVYELVSKDLDNIIQTRIEGTVTIQPSVVVVVP